MKTGLLFLIITLISISCVQEEKQKIDQTKKEIDKVMQMSKKEQF